MGDVEWAMLVTWCVVSLTASSLFHLASICQLKESAENPSPILQMVTQRISSCITRIYFSYDDTRRTRQFVHDSPY